MEWLLNNKSTLIIGCVLLVIVILAVRTMIKDKKKGGCSCGCSGCSHSSSCHTIPKGGPND